MSSIYTRGLSGRPLAPASTPKAHARMQSCVSRLHEYMHACNHASMQSIGSKRQDQSAHPEISGRKEPLQIRIPTAIKRRFKSHAALLGVEPNELFVTVWEQYEASQSQSQISGHKNEQED